jgi:hypothetical protein
MPGKEQLEAILDDGSIEMEVHKSEKEPEEEIVSTV